MPVTNIKNMISKSDVKFPPPLKYPGKYNKNNKEGTQLSGEEWKANEAVKWIREMRKNLKYN